MLRTYKPISDDPIFELHRFTEHLVIDIFCNADGSDCMNKIDSKYNSIVSYQWLRESIIEIDNICNTLPVFSRNRIKLAFYRNNDIEGLCNGKRSIPLKLLPTVVETKMKPLFIKFYEELLERAKVAGDKLEFYGSLYTLNRFKYCGCCGYIPFDTGQLERREAYDHYIPKSEYPFASVNFKNLIPLCYKCNSDRKKDKDPLANGRKAFYPFRSDPIVMEISTKLETGFIRSLYNNLVNDIDEEDLNIPKIEEISINITSREQEQIETWDDLFEIRKRFSERTGQFSYSHLRKLKIRFIEKRKLVNNWTFSETIDQHISEYENFKYMDEKYLKISFMKAVRECDGLIKIYA